MASAASCPWRRARQPDAPDLRAYADRSNRFAFDLVADDYVRGRPDMPLEAVSAAAAAAGIPAGARVLEIGAGAGQLTRVLLAAGLDVCALEPGPTLRALAAERAPGAELRGETFEELDTDERFAAIFSANAFHWIDPAVSYAKAASLLEDRGALVLLWDTPFIREPELHRRVQREVMAPRGSTFPDSAEGIHAMLERDAAAGREELAASGLFADPWWEVVEQVLPYSAERYVSLLLSMSRIAAQPAAWREDLAAALHEQLGEEPLTVSDLVYVVASRRR
ncbi:MAG: trans-aconitate 2-methyltransferase [Gaiellaceae bacterium]